MVKRTDGVPPPPFPPAPPNPFRGAAPTSTARVAPAAVAGPHVTDAMALAFHSALSDGALGSDEVEDIKAGLRAALAAAPWTHWRAFTRWTQSACNAAALAQPQPFAPPTGALMPENSLSLSQLPAMGEPLEGGAFAGIVTQPDGTHVAVVLLPDRGEYLEHPTAVAWAQEHGGQLPTSHIAALLFANVKPLLPPRWHWCPETEGASSAWCCTFKDGTQTNLHKSFECSAVAVRLIPLAVASA